jgi:hypothetical protein
MKQFLANNSHRSACKGSQKFANHLANYLYNKLLADTGDPEIAAIITFYLVYLNAWNESYVKWHNALNFQMSTTDQMEILDDILIKTKAPEWAGKIWGVYFQGTPKATALLPHGRKALITGSALDKIAGMNTLIAGIGTDSSLAAVKTDLETFVATYTSTSQQHQAAMKDYKELSKDQEQLRLTTTAAMLRCEGSLTEKYWETSEKVDLFFDISAMRRRQGESQPGAPLLIELLPSEIKLIDIDYTFKDIWEVTNNSDKDACVFFGKTSTITTIPDIKFVIPAGGSLQIDLSTLADDMRFAYAANLSNEDEGELEFVVLPPAK